MRWNVYKRFWNGFANALSIAVATVFMAGCSDVDVAGGASGDAGVVAIKDREIAGVTQKGPFLTGSAVIVQELNGETLSQTGKSFRTKVKSDLGDFVLGGVSLVSPYALLEVNGYYLNEVSWEKSKGKVELYALTDLSDRNHVNVNILTHLTVDRILTLIRREGKSFAEAKKQAEKEVLKSFAIAGDIGNSEDLDLFEDKNGSALLAVSVLMQGERTVAAFSELLSKAAIAFADGGTWNGPEKAEVADWAFQTDDEYWNEFLEEESGYYVRSYDYQQSLLREIEENVRSWKGVDTADISLEKYVNDFWVNEYGLGECSEKNSGEIRENKNEYSKFYNVKFKCDGEYKHWMWLGARNLSESNAFEIVDLRDDAVYKAVRIGNTIWMVENLRYSNGRNDWNSQKNGRLFEYDSAMTACPAGTRLPRYSEVENLLLQYGGAGKSAADSLLLKNGFGATPEKDGTMAMWISTRDVYSGEVFVLAINSTGANIEEFHRGDNAIVRCVVVSESDDVQKTDAPKQYSADKYITDARDDENYRFTEINGKYWLAENLRYREAVTNDTICVHDECYYMCGDEGCLYSWYEAVGDSTHDVCPEGWHLPSRSEWDEMLTFVAMENWVHSYSVAGLGSGFKGYDVGYRLSDFREWNQGDYVLREENDPYDFSAKPVGKNIMIPSNGTDDSALYSFGDAGFWTSSDTSIVVAYGDGIEPAGWAVDLFDQDFTRQKAGIWLENKLNRYSARCVKD